MKAPLKLLSALLIITLLPAFKHTGSNDFLGTYGVSSSDPSQIKLTLNSDYSFYYQDFSSPGNKIQVLIALPGASRGRATYLTKS